MSHPQFTVLMLQSLLYSSVSRSSPAESLWTPAVSLSTPAASLWTPAESLWTPAESHWTPAASLSTPAGSVLGLLPSSDPLSYSLCLS